MGCQLAQMSKADNPSAASTMVVVAVIAQLLKRGKPCARRLLGPIANIPPKEAEARYYAEINTLAMAA